MAHYRTDVLLKKLYYIHTVCADAKKKKIEEEAATKKDSFKQQKDKIARQIREAKELIAERDELLAQGGTRTEVTKKTHAIRQLFHETTRDIEILKRMQQKKAQKYEGKTNIKEEVKQRLEREKQIVVYAQKNLEKVMDLERYGKAGNPHKEILNKESEIDTEDGQVLIGEIPDLDDVDFQEMRAMDKKIDEDLDEILKGVEIIKGIAMEVNQELKKQEELLDKLDEQVEKTRVTLVTLNKRLTTVLKKARGPRQCCCDIFLIVLILGVAAAIVFLVT